MIDLPDVQIRRILQISGGLSLTMKMEAKLITRSTTRAKIEIKSMIFT